MSLIVKNKRGIYEHSENILMAHFHMLAFHDIYTKNHSLNVARMAEEIAKKMSLNNELIKETYYAGLVHDIGKSCILQDILNKRGSLTYSEFALIRRHPKLGYNILKKYDRLNNIAKYILHHHERWDGNGYPDKLSGSEIPLICQILSVVDACDAMLNERAYSPALSIDRTITELINGRGTQFSPGIVDIFLTIIDG